MGVTVKSLLAPLLRNLATPVPFVGRAPAWPWTPRNDAEAYMRAFGAVGTLFNIVSTTSQATGEVEWELWRKSRSGKKEDRTRVTTHAALDVWNTPNPFMTRQELVETAQQHIDLTGEGWLVVGRNAKARSIPLELWPVRPDRMMPVPSPTDFLTGYIYSGPSGEQVPLEKDSVLMLRMPNPLDPYRGMGPVQSILIELDSSRYSSEWNRNFFLNSAEPGGIIEVDKRLSDDEFAEMTTRWREQHQGVAQAHRVAVLEQGKWVDRKFTQKDMQFVELRAVSKETIREAFGFPKFAAGEVNDVNRATADASIRWFARRLTVPRLQRWKSMLNNDLLPLFGADPNLEFDFVSPMDEDEELENAETTVKANAAKVYIDAGFEADSVKAALDLPEALVWKEPPPPPPPPPMSPPAPGGEPPPAQGDQAPPAAPAAKPAAKPAEEAIPAKAVAELLTSVLMEARRRDEDRSRSGRFQYWS